MLTVGVLYSAVKAVVRSVISKFYEIPHIQLLLSRSPLFLLHLDVTSQTIQYLKTRIINYKINLFLFSFVCLSEDGLHLYTELSLMSV